jgi:FkbM family methyltransferase
VREPKILKTKYLFFNLLHFLKPKLILDVGSMDGSDSLRFRQMSSGSRIIAIEASPYNYKKMISDYRLSKAGIEVVNTLIASDEKQLDFYITHESESVGGASSVNRGSSSLLEPLDKSSVVEKISLDAIRLDKYITVLGEQNNDLALWIDVEGAGYDVLESIGVLKKNISLLHIEVEITPKWVNQKLKPDLIELANQFNLVLLATSKNPDQQDLVFINKSLLEKHDSLVKLVVNLTKYIGPPSSRVLRYF